MIGNSGINKEGSREVFEHFHEPGSAVDDSSRCIYEPVREISNNLTLTQV